MNEKWSKRCCGISADPLFRAPTWPICCFSARTQTNNPWKLKDKPMNILPGNMRFGAGQPVKRLEHQRLVTGKGQFVDDRPEDEALWLHVLRSPHAHAKIVSVDTKAATDMPDVKAVY